MRVTAANKNKKRKPDQVLVNEQDEIRSCGGLNAEWHRVSESAISFSLLMGNPAAILNKSFHVYVFSI